MSGLLSLMPLEGFEPPGVHSFDYPPIIPGVEWFDKYIFQAILAVIIILAFWLIMARKQAMVPSKSQFLGETAYFFIRNTIARDMIGHDYRKYLPLIIALFSFVLVNNLWRIFPLAPAAHPVTRRLGLRTRPPGLGDLQRGRHHQVRPLGYLKNTTLPAGVPKAMWPLIIPLEFLSNIIIRPLTLSLRLFANMFAGHLLILVFVLGGEYLVLHSDKIVNNIAGVVAWIFSDGDLHPGDLRAIPAGLHLRSADRPVHLLGCRRGALIKPVP